MVLRNSANTLILKNNNNDPALQDKVRRHRGIKRTLSATLLGRRRQAKKTISFGTVEVFRQPWNHLLETKVFVPDLWYTEEEYANHKLQFCQEAKNLHRIHNGGCVLVAFERCTKNQEVLELHLQQALKEHFRNDTKRIGFERIEDEIIFRDKKLRRNLLYAIVNDIQNRRFRNKSVRAEALRTACHAVTHVSVLFARHIAQASYAAFVEEEDLK